MSECSEGIPALERDGDQYSDGLGDVLPGDEELGRPHSEMSEWGGEEKVGTTQKEEKRTIKSLGRRIRLEWGIAQENMLRSSLENENGARVVSANGFKHQEDLKMYIRLPDYDDSQCYDLGLGGILS